MNYLYHSIPRLKLCSGRSYQKLHHKNQSDDPDAYLHFRSWAFFPHHFKDFIGDSLADALHDICNVAPIKVCNMQEYQSLDYDGLVDLLSNETEKLTQLLSERRFDDEYYQ